MLAGIKRVAKRSDVPSFGKVVAVVVGLEEYRPRPNRISGVPFARADAAGFRDALEDIYDSEQLQISMLLDAEASKQALDFELKLAIESLSASDLFLFYYAGHGFHGVGGNRLTVYDTYQESISNTTLLLRDALTDRIAESECERALIFVDACASKFDNGVLGRETVTDLSAAELQALVDATGYCAVYLSCKPGQRSYPSKELKHGIWTHFLLEALTGAAEGALDKNRLLTDVSLRDYLRREVPRYITKNTTLKAHQEPHALITASSTFVIRAVPVPLREIVEANDLSSITGIAQREYLEDLDEGNIRKLEGFKRGNVVPDYYSAATRSFVVGLLKDGIADDIQSAYTAIKREFRLRKADIARSESDAEGTLDTDFFRFEISGEQHPDDPSQYRIIRRLEFRKYDAELVSAFDRAFGSFDYAVVDIDARGLSFDSLVERFEDLAEDNGGRVNENETAGTIEYDTVSGDSILVDLENGRVTFSARSVSSPSEIIGRLAEYRFGLTGSRRIFLAG